MRFRKANALIGAGFVFTLFYVIYLLVDSSPSNGLYGDPEAQKLELTHLEAKLKNLENDLAMNLKIMSDIQGSVKDMLTNQAEIKHTRNDGRARGGPGVNKTIASVDKQDLAFCHQLPLKTDIDMGQVYDKLKFDNPDGGAWKQGWDIQYDSKAWSERNKLQVFVVPHSHNDPGWIKTFEKYFVDQTKKILDLMVPKLAEDSKRKFIWAEISYFSMWWARQDMKVKEAVQALLDSGQLEIVTGGWVMNDEANTHYWAMLEQLLAGHEWCNLNLNGYRPNSGWSIDPFGMTPTMAYLLKRMGFDNMLIQRTHYSVKKHLAGEKSLEFRWRQHWDHSDSSDMLCHMMPFYSYDVPHTCGPDPKVCCQFDFLRLPGSRATCPWRVAPKRITDDNVGERAALLLDQYRKKASLYKSNVVLVPLGDDFRWDSAKEWDDQFTNYQKLMDHINSRPELHASVHWGTLTDYFTAVRKSSESLTGDEAGLFPSLAGDFFTYADRDDHYWSGYFTTRPFWKNMDRILEGYLRAAEIMFSMAWAEMEYVGADQPQLAELCMTNLLLARENLGLFQHHDGITGTAKDHVVLDYGEKMLHSIHAAQEVLSHSANFLLTSGKATFKADLKTTYFDLDDTRQSVWSVPVKTVVQIDHPDAPSRLVVFNSHTKRRQEVVTVKVSQPNVKVYYMNDIDGFEEEEVLPSQLSPVLNKDSEISPTEFQDSDSVAPSFLEPQSLTSKLSFLASVPALGLATFFIRQLKPEEGTNDENSVASLKIFNFNKNPYQVAPFDSVKTLKTGEKFSLTNSYIRADFSQEGLLQSVTTLDDGLATRTQVEFVSYGTRSRGDKSGAYLFLPDGPGRRKGLERPLIRIVEGKILSYVEVIQPWNTHRVIVKNSPGVDGVGLEIENNVNMDHEMFGNVEISMRVSSDISSADVFYTDLNGFQMIRRRRYKKLPLQANWYPVSSMAYIQDSRSRLSLVTGQPLGGTSSEAGQLEIMLDRRLLQDDNRGLFQGIQDNKLTPHKFVLLLERRVKDCSKDPDSLASYPSLLGHAIRHSLLNPYYRLIFMPDHFTGHGYKKTYKPVDKDLPCDIHLVNLRTMLKHPNKAEPSDNAALIVHRQGFNSCYKPLAMTCATNGGKICLEELLPELYSNTVKQMSLSLMYDGMKMEKSFTVSIQPMEMYSFLLTR